MRVAVCIAGSLLAVLLAGCTGDEPASAGPETVLPETSGDVRSMPEPGSEQIVTSQLQLPDWRVGDWWTYTASDGTAFPYVLARDDGAEWWMGTPDESFAFFNAQSDVSFLGPIRKSDLAGSQGSDRVQYFRWPLEDGAAWSTRWDGLSLEITATVPAEGIPSFEGRRPEGTLYVAYTYDPAARWFGELTFYDENETEMFGAELTDRGEGFEGQIVDWELESLLADSGAGSMFDPVRPFTVAAGTTDLWLSYTLDCPEGHGGYLVAFAPAALEGHQQNYLANGACDGVVAFAGPAIVSPEEGNWVATLSWGEGADTPVFEILLLQRVLLSEPVGGA